MNKRGSMSNYLLQDKNEKRKEVLTAPLITYGKHMHYIIEVSFNI